MGYSDIGGGIIGYHLKSECWPCPVSPRFGVDSSVIMAATLNWSLLEFAGSLAIPCIIFNWDKRME